MSRFEPANWVKPPVTQKDSASLIADFAELSEARRDADAKILGWSKIVTQEWLDVDLRWFSGSVGSELSMATSFLVAHFFNTSIIAARPTRSLPPPGEKTGDTDLFLVF